MCMRQGAAAHPGRSASLEGGTAQPWSWAPSLQPPPQVVQQQHQVPPPSRPLPEHHARACCCGLQDWQMLVTRQFLSREGLGGAACRGG